jgi:DNA-binding NarL/FixJ family response regulator
MTGIETLSPREREVLAAMHDGASNREIGKRLGISPRTAEVHRANLIIKLKVRNSTKAILLYEQHLREGQAAAQAESTPA